MSTSAFTWPTTCPSRSTLTARRLPDICVDRFIAAAPAPSPPARPAQARRARCARHGRDAGGSRSRYRRGRRSGRRSRRWRRGNGLRERTGHGCGRRVLGPHLDGTRRQLLLQHLDALRDAGHALLDLREDLLLLLERQRVERLAIGDELVEQLAPDLAQIDADALGIVRRPRLVPARARLRRAPRAAAGTARRAPKPFARTGRRAGRRRHRGCRQPEPSRSGRLATPSMAPTDPAAPAPRTPRPRDVPARVRPAAGRTAVDRARPGFRCC